MFLALFTPLEDEFWKIMSLKIVFDILRIYLVESIDPNFMKIGRIVSEFTPDKHRGHYFVCIEIIIITIFLMYITYYKKTMQICEFGIHSYDPPILESKKCVSKIWRKSLKNYGFGLASSVIGQLILYGKLKIKCLVWTM